MDEKRRRQRQAKRDADLKVLGAVASGPLFGIEIEPEECRAPGGPKPIGEAIGRCLNIGWLRTGAPGSCDPRIWLAPAGIAELRRAAGADDSETVGPP